jgi:hypothetical protein
MAKRLTPWRKMVGGNVEGASLSTGYWRKSPMSHFSRAHSKKGSLPGLLACTQVPNSQLISSIEVRERHARNRCHRLGHSQQYSEHGDERRFSYEDASEYF